MLDLGLDLRRLGLEERALPEDFVQEGVVLQLVPGNCTHPQEETARKACPAARCERSKEYTAAMQFVCPGLHDSDDGSIDDVLALNRRLSHSESLQSDAS